MGAAQLQFYSSLVDLLGRCAPEAEAIKAGRSDSLRARAILRSLVSLEDLEGALGMRFILPVGKTEQVGRLGDGVSLYLGFIRTIKVLKQASIAIRLNQTYPLFLAVWKTMCPV
jgi:hypothetical protein